MVSSHWDTDEQILYMLTLIAVANGQSLYQERAAYSDINFRTDY